MGIGFLARTSNFLEVQPLHDVTCVERLFERQTGYGHAGMVIAQYSIVSTWMSATVALCAICAMAQVVSRSWDAQGPTSITIRFPHRFILVGSSASCSSFSRVFLTGGTVEV